MSGWAGIRLRAQIHLAHPHPVAPLAVPLVPALVAPRPLLAPRKPTFKNGTRVMLDSRVNTPRTITIGSKSYPMLSYGFRLETLSSSTLPQTLVVDCGNRQNVGTILLQR